MKRAHGFTLIELLVVIAIVALLSSVILASLSKARMKARDARRVSDLSQIMLALELYFDTNGYYPGTYDHDAILCPTAPATPCWDTTNYNYSFDSASWQPFASSLTPYINLPKDPINSPCQAWIDGCYSYAYGNVGRFGKNYSSSSIASKPNTYELIAQFEDPTNPLACRYKNYSWGYGSHLNDIEPWCIQFGGGYSNNIYDPSPN